MNWNVKLENNTTKEEGACVQIRAEARLSEAQLTQNISIHLTCCITLPQAGGGRTMTKKYIKEPDNCEQAINWRAQITCSMTLRTKPLFLIVHTLCSSHSRQLSPITDV